MSHPSLLEQLYSAVGIEHVITDQQKSQHYRKGWRSGGGEVLAVVLPQNLLSFYRVLQACVAHRAIIIMQAANTGLTEGSTPNGNDYDRPVVLINTLAMNQIVLLEKDSRC